MRETVSKLIDETGNRYGRLTVVARGPNDRAGKARWHCRCDCGKETLSQGAHLRRGRSQSCGCASYDEARRHVATRVATGIKPCPRCGDEKSMDEFHVNTNAADGCTGWCKRCQKDHKLRKTYGITVSEYERMSADQDAACCICGETEALLVVDHDHDTGDIRGLLCRACNRGIGMLSDDPKLLTRATAYLSEGDSQ